jgi:opacity protein-like surface antigen
VQTISKEQKMKKILLVLAAGMALSASASFAATDADVGVLTCKLKNVKNDIVYTKEEFACELKPTSGKVEEYTGQIKSIGINLSVTKDLTLVWAVLNPTGGLKSDHALKGDYVGGGASVALGAAAGANVLVGGGDNSFTLQPLSVSGIVGAGVNVGIKQFQLR